VPHIKRLDDALGDFLVCVNLPVPEALARIAELALRMRCSQCGKKVAEVVAVARPRPRGGG
jgi:3-methyladenine DNA glycosylase/8-oxoguanine DNA glycosylase